MSGDMLMSLLLFVMVMLLIPVTVGLWTPLIDQGHVLADISSRLLYIEVTT